MNYLGPPLLPISLSAKWNWFYQMDGTVRRKSRRKARTNTQTRCHKEVTAVPIRIGDTGCATKNWKANRSSWDRTVGLYQITTTAIGEVVGIYNLNDRILKYTTRWKGAGQAQLSSGTGYGVGRPAFNSRQRGHSVQTSSRAHRASYPMGTGEGVFSSHLYCRGQEW
jgi:hypothetical protein